jgi:phage-related protein
MDINNKDVVWLHGEIKTPPFKASARIEAGFLLRKLQQGEKLSMPQSRPMPIIGKRCHELRIVDGDVSWRIVHRVDPDALVILEIFQKKTQKMPKRIVESCKIRLRDYDNETS